MDLYVKKGRIFLMCLLGYISAVSGAPFNLTETQFIGILVGACTGSALLVLILVVAVYCCCCRKTRSKDKPYNEEETKKSPQKESEHQSKKDSKTKHPNTQLSVLPLQPYTNPLVLSANRSDASTSYTQQSQSTQGIGEKAYAYIPPFMVSVPKQDFQILDSNSARSVTSSLDREKKRLSAPQNVSDVQLRRPTRPMSYAEPQSRPIFSYHPNAFGLPGLTENRISNKDRSFSEISLSGGGKMNPAYDPSDDDSPFYRAQSLFKVDALGKAPEIRQGRVEIRRAQSLNRPMSSALPRIPYVAPMPKFKEEKTPEKRQSRPQELPQPKAKPKTSLPESGVHFQLRVARELKPTYEPAEKPHQSEQSRPPVLRRIPEGRRDSTTSEHKSVTSEVFRLEARMVTNRAFDFLDDYPDDDIGAGGRKPDS